jgi:hypothetical protein
MRACQDDPNERRRKTDVAVAESFVVLFIAEGVARRPA